MLFFEASLFAIEVRGATASGKVSATVPSKVTSKVSPGVTPKPSKLKAKPKTKTKTKKKVADFNAPAIAAFKAKKYVEALRLFNVAIKNDPQNPLSWLGHARATVAIHGSSEPENYCDFEKNWVLLAMSSLSKAMDLGRAKVEPILSAIKDVNFQKFRTRPEYKNWDLVRKLPLKTDLATQEFFSKHNDWLIDSQPNPSTVVTFAPTHVLTIAAADGTRSTGTWSAGAGRVVIKTKDETRTLNLTTSKHTFGSPEKSFRIIVLRDPAKPPDWTLGPEIADCPKP